MVTVTTGGLDLITSGVLDSFDIYTHIALGSSSTGELTADSTLKAELLRKAFDITAVKSVGAGTYEYTMRVTLGELNSSTMREIGIFDAASSGNMALRKVLTTAVTKTVNDELYFKVKVTIVSSNN